MHKQTSIKLLFFLLILLPLQALVQESKVNLNGYVKDLYLFYLPEKPIPGADLNYLTNNIVHNRLNFKWYAGSRFTTVVEMRNRLMSGNLIRNYPDYQSTVDVAKLGSFIPKKQLSG